MIRFGIPPLVRISFSVTMLTVSLLLMADMFGVVPDRMATESEHRKAVAETLAVQVTRSLSVGDSAGIVSALESVVERNDSVLSAALRDLRYDVRFAAGNHDFYWSPMYGSGSLTNQVALEVFNREGKWGQLELSFQPMNEGIKAAFKEGSLVALVAYVAVIGFFAYMFLFRRLLNELNTDDVLPDRVSSALDTLTEGIVILDTSARIVFTNEAFSSMAGVPAQHLAGRKIDSFAWCLEATDSGDESLPWKLVLGAEGSVKGALVTFTNDGGRTVPLAVNATAVGPDDKVVQGVLVTLDDLSEVHANNEQLNQLLVQLKRAQAEVTEQNSQLKILATRDPLTDVLNRRSLFQGVESLISDGHPGENPMCFLMVDIDHFKSVNDNYGHGVGDSVIVFLADTLKQHARAGDLVARYGGEEFCVVFPDTSLEAAAAVAEGMRAAVQLGDSRDDIPADLHITASFGVAAMADRSQSPDAILERADQALYHAKEGGRNQVVTWSNDVAGTENPESAVRSPERASSSEAPALLPDPDSTVPQVPHDSPVLPVAVDAASPVLVEDVEHRAYAENQLMERMAIQIEAGDDSSQFAVASIDLVLLKDTSQESLAPDENCLLDALHDRMKEIVLQCEEHERPTGLHLHIESAQRLVMVLTGMGCETGVQSTVARLVEACQPSLLINGVEHLYQWTVGVCIGSETVCSAKELLNRAHFARHAAYMSDTPDQLVIFDTELEKRFLQQAHLRVELSGAVEREELVLLYQPQADLKTGEIVGVEALVRWQHPQHGLLGPADFIPLAERDGSVFEIGQWVLRTACKQIRLWREQNLGDVRIAINVSAMEIQDPSFVDRVSAALLENGIPPALLELEITESVALSDIDLAIETLSRLSEKGVRLSIDDFGTGFGSLSYLQRLPVHMIKIDMSFTQGVLTQSNDAAIVSAVIAMGHTLGLQVLAEGVEVAEQLYYLQDLRCDQVQGYFIGKPVKSGPTSALLREAQHIKRAVLDNPNRPRDLHRSDTAPLLGVLNEAPSANESNHRLPRAS